MSLLQALLIGCVAALTQLEGDWLGECKLREPIITGCLVGLIMGDLRKGLIIGAELQVMWMGATNIGPTAGLDIGTGGTIGAAIALMTGTGVEVAIAFGLPVAIIMQFLNMLKMTAFSGLMHKVDSYIDELKEKAIVRMHYLCGFFTFSIYFTFTFVALYFGNSVINVVVNGIPAWANAGLGAVAVILPAMGFALLLNMIWETKLIPFFILGFIISAYTQLTMIAVTAIAVAVAWIIYIIKSDQIKDIKLTTVSSTVVNEWED